MSNNSKLNRFERKKLETRQKIICSAMNLINRQGFESTTLDQIAEEADVAKKTIYNYFPNKEDIVIAYIQRETLRTEDEVIRLLDQLPDTKSRLVAATIGSLEWLERELNIEKLDKFYVYLLLKVMEARSTMSGDDLKLCYILRKGQEAGEIRGDISAQELANNLEWIHASIVLAWAHNREINAKELYERKVELFLEGAKKRS